MNIDEQKQALRNKIKLIESFLILWEATDGETDTVNALTDFWQAYAKRNNLDTSISADELLSELIAELRTMPISRTIKK